MDKWILASGGMTDWTIVIPQDAIESEQYAAAELGRFLKEISGAEFPVADDTAEPREKEILVGFGKRTAALQDDWDIEGLGQDGFYMKTCQDKLVLAGGRPRGTLYAVYAFLEEVLGCRWFTTEVQHIPQRDPLVITELNDRQVPALEYREDYNRCTFNGDWAARNRLLGQVHRLESRHGGTMRYNKLSGGAHSFDRLVPVAEYFDTHPEYFSEVDGKRIRERTQLCLTNPDVIRISKEKVLQWIEEDPEATMLSIAQNDCYNPCQCERCRAIDEAEGSHSGTLLYFVNQIAEVVAEKYPDKKIGVLAYQYTRKPPKTIKPASNVVIRLCSIECCFSHPMETCNEIMSFKARTKKGASFIDDLKGWGAICNQVHIWDYTTNFMHFLMPFPNFQVLAPNIRFFINNHVTGIFEQGNGDTLGGEMEELRAYVIAKLLWNPWQDTDLLIQEFLNGYYKMAAGPIYQYIKMLQNKVVSENIHMGIYDPPTTPYLSEDILSKANELFDKAESLADDEEILKRVRRARLGIEYVELATMEKDAPMRLKKVAEFFRRIEEEQITFIREDVSNEKMRELFDACPEDLHYHQ